MPDWLRYIASYQDLIVAFGADAAAGETHYNRFGRVEGRSLTGFNPYLYGATHADLARAFGVDAEKLERHYIEFGYREGRAVRGFDALRYGASYPDLARAFGDDETLLAKHYLQYGLAEGRQPLLFDALAYAAGNADLIKAFGSDTTQLTRHYLRFGAHENRTVNGFDDVGYLLANRDLAGVGAAGALRHWVEHGFGEGRGASPFGADQTGHDASLGRVTAGRFEQDGDCDWYVLNATAGQKLSLSVLRTDLVGGVVAGAGIQAFDASGRALGGRSMTADGFDNWLALVANADGPVYISVTAGGSATDYQLGVARVGADYVPGAMPGAGGFTGGALTDVFLGGNGSSIIQGGGDDDILGGGAGQDDFYAGAGADFMDGGNGVGADNTSVDSVVYTYSPSAVTVYMDGRAGVGGYADGDRLLNIEAVFGSAYADKLYGSIGDDQIQGGAGKDEIRGGAGNDYFLSGEDGDDRIYGEAGNDTLSGGAGADLLDGGDGFDIADYQLSDTGVCVDLRSGIVSGGAAGDTLLSIEGVIGSYSGNDVLATAATAAYQQLLGYGGDDILIDRSLSNNGAFLVGNAGNDLLVGLRIRGDEGDDTLVSSREQIVNFADGQSGSDTYVVETSRHSVGTFDFSLTIPSFDSSDRIDLSQLRDEGGRVLDMADIAAHARNNIIDLTGFRTAAGTSVVGYIELNQQAGLFEPITPFSTDRLVADDFIFSGGSDWKTRVPADFPIF